MDIGLAAQLRRLLQVPGPLRHVPPLGQAAVIDPLPVTGPLQRPIRLPLPRLAGVLQPRLGHRHPGFSCSALLRGRRVVPPEPLLPAALDAIVGPLREHQVRVGVLPVSAMDRQRVGQPLPFGHPPGEPGGQFPPLSLVQFLGKRELDFPVQPPVGPLVLVRRLPIRARVTLGPLRHMLALAVLQFLPVLLVAPLALDVIGLGRRRPPIGTGTDAHF